VSGAVSCQKIRSAEKIFLRRRAVVYLDELIG
jgi:hypothetical protein